ncbi:MULTISPECIES: FecR family protein [Roseobacteraceae]|uniref:Fec operon regulator FecR n=1 Tax=Pseudosulfitobacter pseudonitzschiae TaxID=1402135 RepID=A0A221K8K8_9RHOB|nr:MULTISPECIES: FecR domain-containing protein [Roseobacteraceae]ASM75203.1 fec operon regulator FecR [Pseudosulfitobacter pseudonitzschiae]
MSKLTPSPKLSEELSDEALGWIVKLNSGEATIADRQKYNVWRDRSLAHTAAALEAESVWDMAGHVHRDPVSDRIAPGRRVARLTRRQVLSGLAGIAAVGVNAPWISRQAVRLMADEATGFAEIRTITLPDRTLVALNARSALDTDFRNGRRNVLLKQGQGYFTRLDDTDKGPFNIHTPEARIDLSTEGGVDVNYNMPRGQMAVAAVDTIAQVRFNTRSLPIEIQPGARAVFGVDGALISMTAGTAGNAIAWRQGLLIAENTSFEEIIAGLRPWYPGRIIVAERDAAMSSKVNAVLDLHDPESALNTLARGLPIRLYRVGHLVTMIT